MTIIEEFCGKDDSGIDFCDTDIDLLFSKLLNYRCAEGYNKEKSVKRQVLLPDDGFDWVFLNCVKTIYVCDYQKNTIAPIVLPKNAESFLNTEAEYLRYCHDWEDGMSI